MASRDLMERIEVSVLTLPCSSLFSLSGMNGLTSTATYTANGVADHIYASAIWQTEFTLPSVRGGWAPGPSRRLNTGIVTLDGTQAQYIDLNDVNDHHAVAGPFPSHLPQGGFSLAFWLRPSGSGNNGRIFDCADSTNNWPSDHNFVWYKRPSGDNRYCVATNDQTLLLPALFYCIASPAVIYDVWHLFVLVMDRSNSLSVYVNGALKDFQDFMYPSTRPRPYCYLGRSNNYALDDTLKADYAYAGYWNRPLVPTEIVAMRDQPPLNIRLGQCDQQIHTHAHTTPNATWSYE
jgi:hypothetical protein